MPEEMSSEEEKGRKKRRILERIWGRIDQIRTSLYRRLTFKRSEEDRLKMRIMKRVKKLGKAYEDGNSDILGYTYHPIPFDTFGKVKAHRKDCNVRLEAILKELVIEKGDWILDVGANVGFFSFSMAKMGAYVESYETNSDSFEIGAALSKLYNYNVLYINKAMSVANLNYLRPHYRAVLLLSIFHWIVKQEGEEGAARILIELAKRADFIFFDAPSDPEDGMFKHKYFISREAVEKYIKGILPAARLIPLTQDDKWGKRFLYKIDCTGIS